MRKFNVIYLGIPKKQLKEDDKQAKNHSQKAENWRRYEESPQSVRSIDFYSDEITPCSGTVSVSQILKIIEKKARPRMHPFRIIMVNCQICGDIYMRLPLRP